MVVSRSVLLPKAMSRFLSQQAMDVAPIAIEVYTDAQGLSGPETSHLRPRWCSMAWLLLEP